MIRMLASVALFSLVLGIVLFSIDPASTSSNRTRPLQDGTATPTPESWFSYFPYIADLSLIRISNTDILYDWRGCRHILPNGSFEEGEEHWTLFDTDGTADSAAMQIVESSTMGIDAQHGSSVLRIHAASRIEDNDFPSINSMLFPPIPKDKFESYRIGAWVYTLDTPVPPATEESLYFGMDTSCDQYIPGGTRDWQHYSCESNDQDEWITEDTWAAWLYAWLDDNRTPPESSTWLVDALSIEVCLK